MQHRRSDAAGRKARKRGKRRRGSRHFFPTGESQAGPAQMGKSHSQPTEQMLSFISHATTSTDEAISGGQQLRCVWVGRARQIGDGKEKSERIRCRPAIRPSRGPAGSGSRGPTPLAPSVTAESTYATPFPLVDVSLSSLRTYFFPSTVFPASRTV